MDRLKTVTSPGDVTIGLQKGVCGLSPHFSRQVVGEAAQGPA